jgi:hypothetical protein
MRNALVLLSQSFEVFSQKAVGEEMDGGVEELQDRRRESVGEEKEKDGTPKEATDPGVVGQLTGALDDARQKP